MRIAFDVDLRAIHGYSERDGRVCFKATEWPWEVILAHDTILVEVASPVNTARTKSQRHNRNRWNVHNCLQVGRLWYFLQQCNRADDLLVSPAEKWTLGHREEEREIMAGCYKQDNHDIRACRCMLFFHDTNPNKWVRMADYYQAL